MVVSVFLAAALAQEDRALRASNDSRDLAASQAIGGSIQAPEMKQGASRNLFLPLLPVTPDCATNGDTAGQRGCFCRIGNFEKICTRGQRCVPEATSEDDICQGQLLASSTPGACPPDCYENLRRGKCLYKNPKVSGFRRCKKEGITPDAKCLISKSPSPNYWRTDATCDSVVGPKQEHPDHWASIQECCPKQVADMIDNCTSAYIKNPPPHFTYNKGKHIRFCRSKGFQVLGLPGCWENNRHTCVWEDRNWLEEILR